MTWLTQGADLPAELHEVLHRGTATDPGDRQPDATTWLAEVEAALEPPASPTVGLLEPGDASARRSDTGATAYLRSWRRLAALTLLAVLLGLGGGWLLRGSGEPPAVTASARLQIEAPEQVTVGQPATFTLRHLGVDSWVWVLPTGAHVVDQETVTVTPTGPGTATVSVRALDPEGRDLADSLEFRVSEP